MRATFAGRKHANGFLRQKYFALKDCVAKSLKSLFRITTRHTHLERLIRANLLIFFLVLSEFLCSTRSLSSHSLKSANLFTLLGVELKVGKFIGIVFVMSRDFSIVKRKKTKLSCENSEHGKKKLPAQSLTKCLRSACNPLGNRLHLLANQSAPFLEGML